MYAAIPGGGSFERSDISRMRRALVAGFIIVGRSESANIEDASMLLTTYYLCC